MRSDRPSRKAGATHQLPRKQIMANFSQSPCYSPKFISALSQVAEWHKFQIRKVGNVPYISHLLSVAALVFENGGSEDEAIAALCHDAVEDVGIELSEIEIFGSNVAKIVSALSEDKSLPKSDRKAAYIQSIDNSNKSVALVSACDKLHNLRGYCQSPQLVKPDVIAFYVQLYPIYENWLDRNVFADPQHPILKEMKDLIEEKLLKFFSVYISINLDGEEILRVWGEFRPITGRHLRVATSEQIINMGFSADWEAMPDVLKLADGEFKKADLKSRQDALRPEPDPQLESFYSAIGRRLD